MSRKNIVAGNWKMHKTLEESMALTTEIRGMVRDELRGDTQVILIPPFISLAGIARLLEGSAIATGAQNCHWEDQGAFTGEISAGMVKSTGATFVLVGHSERRMYFGETNEQLAMKTKTVIRHGLRPIFCVGESQQEREDKTYFKVIEKQISEGLFQLDRKEFASVVIAYEPVWAIGTGLTASPEDAQEIHHLIRKLVANYYNEEIADNLSILYGGSVKPDNAAQLFAMNDIDGGLIGGASLKARDFIEICKAAR